ncbi:MAG: phosphate ABC transporter permease subunit PstC [Oscillochloridaceae bacterium]|nr:phosphate ABC transporter permease subunit PstC [Chloroflexaceae bacterium]MDW8389892.1 phosphate ABC transporter permease subunit PstC [Oscillochloridaceae bacterium]
MADQAQAKAEQRAALAVTVPQTIDLRKRPRIGESIIQTVLIVCGFVSIFTTVAIVYVLFQESLAFFADPAVTLVQFFTGTVWQPPINEFGVLPLVNATLVISLIAMLVAVPLGLGMAIYLSEYASERTRGILKPVIELLAGIPTVVYGFFALTFVTPILRGIFGDVVSIYNMLSAGLVVGVLITPIIATLSEDALSAVPNSLRQASFGLGATKWETAIKVVVPAALSGILAGCIVAMSRAVGETMVVALAAGAKPNLTWNPFESAETMTGYIARISGGDPSYGSMDYKSIFAVGLLLFFITLALNIASRRIVRRFREVYD